MLAWSTEINTIMKGNLTMILDYLVKVIPWFFLVSCIYHFNRKINKLKYQFFDFCTLFFHILQIYLKIFFFFIENYHKCNISMRLWNFRARKHYWTLVSTLFFHKEIGRRQLNFLLYGQSEELFRVCRSAKY